MAKGHLNLAGAFRMGGAGMPERPSILRIYKEKKPGLALLFQFLLFSKYAFPTYERKMR